MKTILLIDGDEILYKVGFGSQKQYYKIYEENEEVHGELFTFSSKKEADHYISDKIGLVIKGEVSPFSKKKALLNTKAYVQQIQDSVGDCEVLFLFSSNNNFRNKETTFIKYKENRDNFIKPIHYENIKEYIMKNYQYVCFPDFNLEADDLLAIYHTIYSQREENYKPVIVSQDKDLLQVPGYHLNLDTKLHNQFSKPWELFEISVVQGLQNFYIQMITGDTVDNIPGYKKLTGKNVRKVFKNSILESSTESEMLEIVKDIYSKYYLFEDLNFILQEIGTCLYMKRDWNDKFNVGDN